MRYVDAGGTDRLAVLVQYRMATTEQLHLLLTPDVRIEQTRRRLAKLRYEGLVERITLPQAGRLRVWLPTAYGVQIAGEWPELRGQRSSRTVSDRTAVRLRAGHGLTVTAVALAFVQDARRHGDTCLPLDWIPEVHHPLGGGEAVIPDALFYYRKGSDGRGAMLRAFMEVDRATMGPERLGAKLGAYARLHSYVPRPRPARDAGRWGRSRRRRNGDAATRSSPGCCSSSTAPAPPGSTTVSAPYTQPPANSHRTLYWASPSWPRHWPTSSTTGPAHPSGAPSRIPTNTSAGATEDLLL
ncbi:replication-relaxation family protein [Streptomyces sp. NPDC085946]|uniref:replication-relaxation family protein n=1 Tax=Streptomyces sp. NPDC085946 TaxID=3365744 RepID=UPI0037CEB482